MGAGTEPLNRHRIREVATPDRSDGIGPAGSGSSRREPSADAERAFTLCDALLQAGDPRAKELLDGCLARYPAHSAGWRRLGETLNRLGQPKAALVCLERSWRAAPSADGALAVGTTLRALGRIADAREAFAEAGRLDSTSVRARFLEGVAAQDGGDFAGAAAAYRGALALDPRLAEAELNLGTALQDSGDLAGARAAYARAVRLKPDGFGRAAQALTTARTGELWLDLAVLRASLEA